MITRGKREHLSRTDSYHRADCLVGKCHFLHGVHFQPDTAPLLTADFISFLPYFPLPPSPRIFCRSTSGADSCSSSYSMLLFPCCLQGTPRPLLNPFGIVALAATAARPMSPYATHASVPRRTTHGVVPQLSSSNKMSKLY